MCISTIIARHYLHMLSFSFLHVYIYIYVLYNLLPFCSKYNLNYLTEILKSGITPMSPYGGQSLIIDNE
jgi:hypothetical protein